MTNEERSVWLATELMGMVAIPKSRPWIDSDDVWWVKDGRFISRARDWNPFENIAQAKEVQKEMVDRGHTISLDVGRGWCVVKYQRYESNGQVVVAGIADADTESAAICRAAGRALKMWEEAD